MQRYLQVSFYVVIIQSPFRGIFDNALYNFDAVYLEYSSLSNLYEYSSFNYGNKLIPNKDNTGGMQRIPLSLLIIIGY